MVSLSKLKEKLSYRMVDRLEEIGLELIDEAYRNGIKEWEGHTLNLDAGFAYVVFNAGKVATNSRGEKAIGHSIGWDDNLKQHKGWAKIGVPDGTAHEWFDLWLQKYEPKNKKSFELVIVNVTYYGKILEEGRQRYGNGKKYKVVTYLLGELKNKSNGFEGAEVSIL